MDLSDNNAPGVHIQEADASNGTSNVATAIPAFIGYTPQASFEGKSCTNIPFKIFSFNDFQSIFGFWNPDGSLAAQQYNPQYYLVAQKAKPEKGDYLMVSDAYYSLVPDPSTIYYLYNSVKLFYENGGGEAYIVSVGYLWKSIRKADGTGSADCQSKCFTG
ncbi:hypothetical protein [Flavobacterium sp. 3HN19-14]|uniref:hypothetical protein n=1 Tax=Flavobacterium sp. 3HN19-14 TaxID=3448133 RepID=UPI003EE26A9B